MIQLGINVLALAMMIRLLMATDKPWLCAGIYAAVRFVIGAALGNEIASVAVASGLALAAALVYFWILNRFDEGSLIWWIVAIIGVPLVLL